MNITEKVAYVKGLVEGLKLDESKPEVKVLLSVLELLDDVSFNISELQDEYDDLTQQIDEIDEDLYSLEEDFYDDENSEDDEVFYEVTCPSCHETICISEPILLDGGIECPNCKENLEFDLTSIPSTECGCEPKCDCEPECNCKS